MGAARWQVREQERRAFETVFQAMDVDGSRSISLMEFIDFVKRHAPPSALSLLSYQDYHMLSYRVPGR